MFRDPPVKKTLFWCPSCNVPLLGKTCACGAEGDRIPLLKPYDVRPALRADRDLLTGLLTDLFGINEIPRLVLFNKTGGLDRNDLVIANGARFGWLSFHPCQKRWSFVPEFDALPWLLPRAKKRIIDLSSGCSGKEMIYEGRIGGKLLPLKGEITDGPVLLRYQEYTGTGMVSDNKVRVRKLGRIGERTYPDPDWDMAIGQNRQHLRNLERHAIRFIRQHKNDRPCVNVSFSGGKDSTAVLELARRAGVSEVYYVDTGMEFPETLSFMARTDVDIRLHGGGLLHLVGRRGPPKKDDRWCCEELKLRPVGEWLAGKKCVTIQGNRWYESFSRANLPAVIENPYYPDQLNISPIRNWRALEVFLYIWWRGLPLNPLYDLGMERIGCWMCPAMLESEFELVRKLHPDLHRQWIQVLRDHYKGKKIPEEFFRCGLWRWNELPPKMNLLIGEKKNRVSPVRKKPGRRIPRASR
jgi:3'-phosphoadenosine 5'-phosphosulfate sulfotransferase (PAPS reductase)/FAD synthetase